MKQTRRWSSIFGNLTLFIGLAVIWIAFGPVKVGGQASYVMVNGISMEPNYHTGDLIIVRKEGTYQVGDVVAYRDAQMGAYIIHRIIGARQDQFIMKGDNNSWIDGYQPAHDEILGKQWIYAPKAGITMQWLRKPINLSLAIVLLGGFFMTSMITKPPKGKKGKSSSPVSGGMLEGALYLLGFLFLGFLGLAIFAFIRPSTRTANGIQYQQMGNYAYSATGTPGVYDTETVHSGEPVFPKLSCFLNIGFTYNILGNQLQNISGSHQMFARVMDQPSGWQRTLPLITQTAFTGASYSSTAVLDLCQLETMVNLAENETELHTSTYTVEIVTNVAFNANASGQMVADTFEPVLTFRYDRVHLYLANTNGDSDPMLITKDGLADNPNMQANTLSLPGWKPTVDFIRVFALLGLGISLGGLVLMGLYIFNTVRQSEEALIRLRYSSVLVDVYEKNLEPTSTTIDVTSMDDLAKLAERQGTMILHMTSNFLHYYLVQNNGTTYRYVISTGKKGIAESDTATNDLFKTTPAIEETRLPATESARLKTPTHRMVYSRKNSVRHKSVQNETPEPAVSHQKNKFIEKKWPVNEEIPEYVIQTGEIEFVMPQQETEILRKVKL